jgi:hypothetical protein
VALAKTVTNGLCPFPLHRSLSSMSFSHALEHPPQLIDIPQIRVFAQGSPQYACTHLSCQRCDMHGGVRPLQVILEYPLPTAPSVDIAVETSTSVQVLSWQLLCFLLVHIQVSIINKWYCKGWLLCTVSKKTILLQRTIPCPPLHNSFFSVVYIQMRRYTFTRGLSMPHITPTLCAHRDQLDSLFQQKTSFRMQKR